MSRRTLLACAAACGGASVLSACGNGEVDSPGGGAIAALADVPVGGVVSATAPDGAKLLVAQPTAGEAVAFSSICTHQGCTVVAKDGVLACPCHGSQFEPLTGAVRKGPADKPLAPYAVQVVDGNVLPA